MARYWFAAFLLVVLLAPVGTAQAAIITKCGASTGYTYYFGGEAIPSGREGWTQEEVGESEILFSDAERLAAKAEADNLQVTLEKWPEMIHVWHLFYPMLTEGRTAISRVGDFIRENT